MIAAVGIVKNGLLKKIGEGGIASYKEATFNVFLTIEEELKECLHSLTETQKEMKSFEQSLHHEWIFRISI